MTSKRNRKRHYHNGYHDGIMDLKVSKKDRQPVEQDVYLAGYFDGMAKAEENVKFTEWRNRNRKSVLVQGWLFSG